MRSGRRFRFALLAVLGGLMAAADDSGLPERAAVAYESGDWTVAAALYRRLSGLERANPLYWLRLGTALHRAADEGAALEALDGAERAGAAVSQTAWQRALVHGARAEQQAALKDLTRAVQDGRGRPDLIAGAPELASLRGRPEFKALIEQARHNQAPCESRPESRQFDFWIGDWDVVTTREHARAGTSHIERTLGSCVIWENWTSGGDSDYAGKSYNVYNDGERRWEQFWVDNQGGMIHFTGMRSDNVMDFRTAEVPQPDGSRLQRHLRFFRVDADTVRQLSEATKDAGRSWQVEYDFTYLRKRAG